MSDLIDRTHNEVPRYPTCIHVEHSSGGEYAYLQRGAENGAVYKTEGCYFYFMDTDRNVHVLLY